MISKKAACGDRSEIPEPAVRPAVLGIGVGDLADARKRRQHDSAGFEDALDRGECRARVEDELKGLHEQDAVEVSLGIWSACVRSATMVASGLSLSMDSTSLRVTRVAPNLRV